MAELSSMQKKSMIISLPVFENKDILPLYGRLETQWG